VHAHVEEALDSENNLITPSGRNSWVQKVLFAVRPHSMTESEAECRVALAEELLQVVRHARETNFDNL
jgi:hypothetical protein